MTLSQTDQVHFLFFYLLSFIPIGAIKLQLTEEWDVLGLAVYCVR